MYVSRALSGLSYVSSQPTFNSVHASCTPIGLPTCPRVHKDMCVNVCQCMSVVEYRVSIDMQEINP